VNAQDRSQLPHDYCPINVQLVEYRVGALEEAIKQISMAVKTIAENTSQIASLEQRHSETREALERAFKAVSESNKRHESLASRVIEIEMKKASCADVKELADRVTDIETALPSLKKSSRWFDAGIIGLVGLVLILAIKASLKI
jgi:chromosome segregation ATPase